MQEQADREKLLREIVSAISSTLDFDKIRQIFVSKLGNALNSDITALYIRDTKTEKFLPVDKYSLHLSSSDMKSPIGVNVIEDYGWSEHIKKNKDHKLAFSNIEDLKNDFNLYGTKAEEFLIEYKVKSMIAIPVIHAGTFLGFLVLNFVKQPKNITNEDNSKLNYTILMIDPFPSDKKENLIMDDGLAQKRLEQITRPVLTGSFV